MKKVSRNLYIFKKRKGVKERLREQLASRLYKSKQYVLKRKAENLLMRGFTNYRSLAKRTNLTKFFYRKRKYSKDEIFVKIDGNFGLEVDFDKFIEIAEKFIGYSAKKFTIDISDCSRVWSSAITLLCSFRQWTDITAHPKKSPIIASSDSKSANVNSYLSYSGLYNYVRRAETSINSHNFDQSTIVKIAREVDVSKMLDKQIEIIELIKLYSILDDDDIEVFDSIILTEALNNAHEHGLVNQGDRGWWTITQYHPKSGFITLCIADNGIGIKNSLRTGPQDIEILELLKGRNSDSDFIEIAMLENISGARSAATKNYIPTSTLKKGKKSFHRGSRRGNGLSRIRNATKKCGVEFSILSQKGYLQYNSNGVKSKMGSKNSKIFAGTMYHFKIPARQVLN